VQIPRQR
jgi:hypothetical protein